METRIHRLGLAIVAGALALAGACTTGPQPLQAQGSAGAQRQCFLPSQVNGFHAIDDDTVHVTVGARSVYELQLFGTCPNVDWSQRIGIRSTAGGSWVCRGMDAELLVPSAMGLDRCAVTAVRQLSPAEVQAARARRR